ncbi:MAG TPA: TIGR02646 family protein [Burkholderiaceae bacterium]|mgnify:FL=1|jgi:uncharacterized protein (TIGR02646 family)|nr:TIGR02646 family protein [Burkholderiaceae bacterium]
MRSVSKGGGHYALAARWAVHQTELAAGTASKDAWSNYGHRAGTRTSCLAEQFSLCAYAELVLDETDLGMHLDHVKPKSKFPHDTFSHNNLLLSAIDDVGRRQLTAQDVFGGHARGNRYHPTWFIHPLKPDSRRFFHYASDGRMEPRRGLSTRDRRRAVYTIGVMNLNAPVLVNRRRRWLEEIELEIDKLLGDSVALEYFAMVELCPTGDRLRPFHSAVRTRFGALGEAVLAKHCPLCA